MPDRQIVLSAVRSDASAIQLTGCNLRTRSALVMQAPQIWKLKAWHIMTRRGILESIELKKSSSLAEWSPFAVFVSSYKLIRSIRVIDTAFQGGCCSLSFWTFLNRSYAHWFARTSKWIRLSVPMPMWKNSCHWSVGLVFDALCKGRKARSQSVEADLPFAHLVRDQYVTGCQYSWWWTLHKCSKSIFLSGTILALRSLSFSLSLVREHFWTWRAGKPTR